MLVIRRQAFEIQRQSRPIWIPINAIATPAVVPCKLFQNSLLSNVTPKTLKREIKMPEPTHRIRSPKSARFTTHMKRRRAVVLRMPFVVRATQSQ